MLVVCGKKLCLAEVLLSNHHPKEPPGISAGSHSGDFVYPVWFSCYRSFRCLGCLGVEMVAVVNKGCVARRSQGHAIADQAPSTPGPAGSEAGPAGSEAVACESASFSPLLLMGGNHSAHSPLGIQPAAHSAYFLLGGSLALLTMDACNIILRLNHS